MNDDKLSEALGLRTLLEAKKDELPVVVEEIEVLPVQVTAEEDDTIRDIEQARGNIKNIIEQKEVRERRTYGS